MSFTAGDVHMQYQNHAESYQNIEKHLDNLREVFLIESRPKQRRLLLSSYEFAVLTIQTPTDIAEEAFELYKGGEDKSDAFQKVNYWRNKADYIERTRSRFEEVDKVIDLLEEGDVDKAHRHLADHFTGVSTVKAAFTLAMIGFTSRACIDTNVRQVIPEEDPYDGCVISKYMEEVESFSEWAAKKFRDRERPSNFLLQWIIFDLNRGTHHKHVKFWENLGIHHPFGATEE